MSKVGIFGTVAAWVMIWLFCSVYGPVLGVPLVLACLCLLAFGLAYYDE